MFGPKSTSYGTVPQYPYFQAAVQSSGYCAVVRLLCRRPATVQSSGYCAVVRLLCTSQATVQSSGYGAVVRLLCSRLAMVLSRPRDLLKGNYCCTQAREQGEGPQGAANCSCERESEMTEPFLHIALAGFLAHSRLDTTPGGKQNMTKKQSPVGMVLQGRRTWHLGGSPSA